MERLNRKQKNVTPILTQIDVPELSSGEENEALLNKRLFSAFQSTQPFRIEISSDNTSTSDEIVPNQEKNYPDIYVPETKSTLSTDENAHCHSKPKQQNTDRNPHNEPLQAVPSIDGAYSVVKSSMPLSSL